MNAVFVVLAPLAIAIFALVMERFEAEVVGTRGETATPVADASAKPAKKDKSADPGKSRKPGKSAKKNGENGGEPEAESRSGDGDAGRD